MIVSENGTRRGRDKDIADRFGWYDLFFGISATACIAGGIVLIKVSSRSADC